MNKSVWRKKDCSWLPLNKHAMNIFIQTSTNVSLSTVLKEPEHSSLRIRARLSWRTGKHLHVLHVLALTPRARIPDTRIPQLMQPCLGPLKIYISCNDIVRFSGGHTVIASIFGWSYHQWRQWRRWYPLSYCVKGGGLLYTFINSSLVQNGEAVIRWVLWKYFQTSSQRKFLEP